MEEKSYSISQFARICNISIKQLRYYEKKGLVVPDQRDPENDYRYYSHRQISKMLFFQSLRSLNIPFEALVELENQQDLDMYIKTLADNLVSIDKQITELQAIHRLTTEHMIRTLNGKEMINRIRLKQKINDFAIDIETIPEKKVLTTRYPTRVSSEVLYSERQFELLRLCDEEDLHPAGSIHATYHNGYEAHFTDQVLDLETFLPVEGKNLNSKENIGVFGGFRAVTCLYTGPFAHYPDVYSRMEQWAADRDIKLSKISTEEFIIGPAESASQKLFLAHIIIPIIE